MLLGLITRARFFPCWTMANCFSSDLREISGWEHSAVLNMGMPFLAPVQLNPDEATSFQLSGYPFPLHPPPWSIPLEGFTEGRAATASASKSHSEAEKRRRDRINSQLATLRRLIPQSEKMDKAALLGSVVEQVKEMKSRAMEISQVIMIPSDTDEVTIDEYPSPTCKDDNIQLLKASICCDDRPELFSELNRALKSLRLTTMDADIISLGGRIKSIFILCAATSGEGGNICMNTLKQSLRVVLSRIVTSCSNTGSNYRIKSRRQRFFLPSDH